MGHFNEAKPFDATRHEMIPAQPGWFVFEWEGDRTKINIRKAPIVAWHIHTEFYPKMKWEKSSDNKPVQLPTGLQDFFTEAYPISPGGFERDEYLVLGPDGVVYRLNDGHCWPDISGYMQSEWDRIDAEDAKQKQDAKIEHTGGG